jgi:predicted 2-oxoglutarate/Fe(II)-dependent dioxygenase YbiX
MQGWTIVENFLSEEDNKILLDKCKEIYQENKSSDRFLGGYDVFENDRSSQQVLQKVFAYSEKFFKEQYNTKNDLRIITCFGARLSDNSEYVRHQDKNHFYPEQKEGDIIYTSLLYLNDDYSDGELVLENPEFLQRVGTEVKDGDIEIKPKPGTLILMTEEVFHTVKPVSAGERYNFTMFFCDTDSKFKLVKDLL